MLWGRCFLTVVLLIWFPIVKRKVHASPTSVIQNMLGLFAAHADGSVLGVCVWLGPCYMSDAYILCKGMRFEQFVFPWDFFSPFFSFLFYFQDAWSLYTPIFPLCSPHATEGALPVQTDFSLRTGKWGSVIPSLCMFRFNVCRINSSSFFRVRCTYFLASSLFLPSETRCWSRTKFLELKVQAVRQSWEFLNWHSQKSVTLILGMFFKT